jgi:hypothetical protein
MRLDFSVREKACFDFLNLLEKNELCVVIGGYAASSYGFPRFSVDLDIVIPETKTSFFHQLISNQGFTKSKEKSDLAYSGIFERHEKGLVGIDLLINAVESRQTRYSYQFLYIFQNSEVRQVSGWDLSHKARVRVATKDLLIALKIHSLRDADKRDIIMLCYELPDMSALLNHLRGGPNNILLEHLRELQSVLNDQHLKDSLKGVYSVSDNVFEKATKNCHRVLKELISKLQ